MRTERNDGYGFGEMWYNWPGRQWIGGRLGSKERYCDRVIFADSSVKERSSGDEGRREVVLGCRWEPR